jgi:hypothetical protein
MASLYAASEFGTDLQTLGFLGHHSVDSARRMALKRALGVEEPRIAKWVSRTAAQHGIGKAELTGWILAGKHEPEPAGLPTFLQGGEIGPDALPSAYYGGLLRLGGTPNGELWGADLHRKAMPVYLLEPRPEGMRTGWKRRFDRLDDFVFYAVKATLCQRDRITVEEYLDLARERGVRPEEMVPDHLEDERESLARLGLRRAKKVPPPANRFVWLDVLVAHAYLKGATPGDIARLWVDVHRLHTLREDADNLLNPSAAAFWMFKHALFGDENGYKRVLAKSGKKKSPIVLAADAEARRWWDKKKAPFDRALIARAIEMRASARGNK